MISKIIAPPAQGGESPIAQMVLKLPEKATPCGSGALLGALLAGNRHHHPGIPGLVEPHNARSDGTYSLLRHHPTTLCVRLVLKQVVGYRIDMQLKFTLCRPFKDTGQSGTPLAGPPARGIIARTVARDGARRHP